MKLTHDIDFKRYMIEYQKLRLKKDFKERALNSLNRLQIKKEKGLCDETA